MLFKARTAVLITAIGILSLLQQAKASTVEKTVYSFCSQDRCADGAMPNGPLVMDGDGNLYGTTFSGGAAAGTIFELTPDRHNKWKYKILYTLCKNQLGCAEGSLHGGLVLDKSGNLYGETSSAIFELTPKVHGEWRFNTLVDTHIILDGRSADGGALSYLGASTGTLYDGVSPLYGTSNGAGSHGSGAVFELAPHNRHWQFKIIYDFCSKKNCADGVNPGGKLIVSQPDEIFGVTNSGGTPECGCGVVYKLSPRNHPHKLWREITLHSFCSVDNCLDGKSPAGSLAMNESGDLIGTTFEGGDNNFGTIFKVTPDDRHSVETVLHSFCPTPACKEGGFPESGVVFNSAGTMFGTTTAGGAFGYGTIYSLSGSAVTPIHSFCSTNPSPCSDGEWPSLEVTLDNSGDIFGATTHGGNANDGGVVFELRP